MTSRISGDDSPQDNRRAAWARLTPEEKERRLEPMRRASRGPRSAEHAAKLSDAHRKLWASGGPKFRPRKCRACGELFAPASGQQRYCNYECKNANRHAGRYGLTALEYKDLLARQMGACALCGAGAKGFTNGRPLHVDHCHKTGKVRGLLCGDCNTALGRFGDDPKRLRAAARYLEKHARDE